MSGVVVSAGHPAPLAKALTHPSGIVTVTLLPRAERKQHMSLMKDHLLDLPLFRSLDPETSANGAADVRPRQGSQAMQLLTQYAQARIGLTDEEAGQRSGLAQRGAGYWKRCSDLRRLGLIEDSHTTRAGSSGSEMMVCTITAKGLEAYRA